MGDPAAFPFEPYEPEFQADPYPTYERMRQVAPVLFQPEWGLTFFSRHTDVDALLKDRRLGRDIRHVLDPRDLGRGDLGDLTRRLYPAQYPTWTKFIRGSFIDLEPPDHTRLRRLVSKAFTRRSSEELRPRVRETAERRLDRALGDGGMDVIPDYAAPIPVTMIGDLLGIPPADHPQLLAWSHAIVRLFEPNASPEEGEAAERAVTEFAGYVRQTASRRRANPGEDLISALVTVEVDGEGLSEDEVVSTCILTLNAGHEATVHAIGNGVLALLANPDQYARLRGHPQGIPVAVDELLRFDTPLQMFERWVLEDTDWAGHLLRRGTKVGLLMGAANRDPELFVDPHKLDLARPANPHVSFGGGIHYCVGAPLARIELEEAFGALAARVGSLTSATDVPPRITSLVFRGVTSLPVEFG